MILFTVQGKKVRRCAMNKIYEMIISKHGDEIGMSITKKIELSTNRSIALWMYSLEFEIEYHISLYYPIH